jgi:hypothetical protein
MCFWRVDQEHSAVYTSNAKYHDPVTRERPMLKRLKGGMLVRASLGGLLFWCRRHYIAPLWGNYVNLRRMRGTFVRWHPSSRNHE